jgi:acetyl-CoA carboxylase biotin carboxyl carrier protein
MEQTQGNPSFRTSGTQESCASHLGRFAIIFGVHLPLEAVREVAQILSESGLGEISLESTGPGPVTRLTMARPGAIFVASGSETAADEDLLAAGEPELGKAEAPREITVTSAAVGVFRAAKPALVAGDEVKRKQLVATVEALKIPNEIYSPAHATVVEVLVADGQGVEWGQPLMILKPVDAK